MALHGFLHFTVYFSGLVAASPNEDTTCTYTEATGTARNMRPESLHALMQKSSARAKFSQDHALGSIGARVEDGLDSDIIARATDVGETAPLSNDGYVKVAQTCCNLQMLVFFRRVISSMGLEVCDEGGLSGIVPWFTCEHAGHWPGAGKYYTGSFYEMQAALREARPPTKCSFVALAGTCKQFPAEDIIECQSRGKYNPDWWDWGKHCTQPIKEPPTAPPADQPQPVVGPPAEAQSVTPAPAPGSSGTGGGGSSSSSGGGTGGGTIGPGIFSSGNGGGTGGGGTGGGTSGGGSFSSSNGGGSGSGGGSSGGGGSSSGGGFSTSGRGGGSFSSSSGGRSSSGGGFGFSTSGGDGGRRRSSRSRGGGGSTNGGGFR